jgi:hypothetical protein
MAVGFNLSPQRSFVLGLPPSLSERKEKALFASQSVDHHIGLAFSDRT